MKKHYQCPKAKIIINDSPIDVICTSGDGVKATISGYGSDTGGGFSQDNGSSNGAPERKGPWDD